MIELYTDGGARPTNPGPAGWAAVLVEDGKLVQYRVGSEKRSTNNRMELTAAIAGLHWLTEQFKRPEQLDIIIVSDSEYLIKGFTQWMPLWKKRAVGDDWRTSQKHSVENQDLWKSLDIAVLFFQSVSFRHVPGHNGDRWNEVADELCTDAAIHQTSGGGVNYDDGWET